MMQPKIILHGGFFSESATDYETKAAKQKALTEIIKASYEFLTTRSALETVVYAVEQLENCDLFNAGIGSQLQRDGKIRMSASVMDGASKKFSGVINIEDVKNPIRVAEKLLTVEDKVLGGEGALQFAREHGFEYFNPETPQRKREYEYKVGTSKSGTVGCVSLDQNGKLAAATSTGGKGFELPGRISDSATVAGNFANDACGVSCTGVGEDIVSVATAVAIATRVKDGMTLKEAFERSFSELKTFDGFAGAIAIDALGNIFHLDSHPSMVFASFDGDELILFN
jgi:L-asparaginase